MIRLDNVKARPPEPKQQAQDNIIDAQRVQRASDQAHMLIQLSMNRNKESDYDAK